MSSDRLDQLDYYTLLGLARDADGAAVRRAFRTFAVKYHPDRFSAEAPENHERATAIYRRGSEAFEALNDPIARRAYDAALSSGVLRLLEDPETAIRRQSRVAPDAHHPPRSSPDARPSAPERSVTPPHATPPQATPPQARPPQATTRGATPPQASPRSVLATPGANPATRPAAAPESGLGSLRTPQARAFMERARAAEGAGDLRAAWRAIKAALEAEPGSGWIESEFHRVGGRLR